MEISDVEISIFLMLCVKILWNVLCFPTFKSKDIFVFLFLFFKEQFKSFNPLIKSDWKSHGNSSQLL